MVLTPFVHGKFRGSNNPFHECANETSRNWKNDCQHCTNFFFFVNENKYWYSLLLAFVLRQYVHSFFLIIRSPSESQYSRNMRAHALGCINFRTILLIVLVSLRFKISSLFLSSWSNFHSITFCANVLFLSAERINNFWQCRIDNLHFTLKYNINLKRKQACCISMNTN